MPRVFLVQNPSRRDQDTGDWIPKYDLSAASAFGEIVELLPPGPDWRDSDQIAERMSQNLTGPDGYQPADYILALGDPIAISIAMMLALKNAGGFVVALKHERREKCYFPIEIQMALGPPAAA
jgi:hypothetical protein